MKTLHLIEYRDRFRKIDKDLWESGHWDLEPEELAVDAVAFHKTKADPSHFGGLLLSHHSSTEEPGRVILVLRPTGDTVRDRRWAGNRTDVNAYKSIEDDGKAS